MLALRWSAYSVTGRKLKLCPPIDASNIRPPVGRVKTATPSSYLADLAAPLLSATADASAAKRSLLDLKRSSALEDSKTMSSENCCPPACAPIVAWERSA